MKEHGMILVVPSAALSTMGRQVVQQRFRCFLGALLEIFLIFFFTKVAKWMNAQGGLKVTDHSSAEIVCSLTQMIPFISQMPSSYSIRLRYVYSQLLIQKKKYSFCIWLTLKTCFRQSYEARIYYYYAHKFKDQRHLSFSLVWRTYLHLIVALCLYFNAQILNF